MAPAYEYFAHPGGTFPSPFLSPSEEAVCFSLERAANRIKPCKVGAVSPVLAFDPNSALFKRPGLTEQELCQFYGALCHVKQAKRCSAGLCSAVLESEPRAISVTNSLRVCGAGDLTVCA